MQVIAAIEYYVSFVWQTFSLTDYVRTVFKAIKFSEKGTNTRTKEESAYMMFLNYIDECEKGKVLSRAYKEKRACNLQCLLCMHQKVDESAGYTIFSQPRTKEIGGTLLY